MDDYKQKAIQEYLRDLPLKPIRENVFEFRYLPIPSRLRIQEGIEIKFFDGADRTGNRPPQRFGVNGGSYLDLGRFERLIGRSSGGQLAECSHWGHGDGYGNNRLTRTDRELPGVQRLTYSLSTPHEIDTMRKSLLDAYVYHGAEWKTIPKSAYDKLKREHKQLYPASKSIPLVQEGISMSCRLGNILNNADIEEVHQLAIFTEKELLRLPNMGKKSIEEIKQLLASVECHLYTPNYWV